MIEYFLSNYIFAFSCLPPIKHFLPICFAAIRGRKSEIGSNKIVHGYRKKHDTRLFISFSLARVREVSLNFARCTVRHRLRNFCLIKDYGAKSTRGKKKQAKQN